MRSQTKGAASAAGSTSPILSALLLAGLVLVPRATAAEIWRLAPGPSSVEFTIGHLIFSKVTGRFGRFHGTVDCPGDDFTDATVEVSIDVTSIYTGHPDRDRELMSESFFAAERFPEMRFESRLVERTGPATYRMVGDLTIRGITHEVVLSAFYAGERKSAQGKRRDLQASGSISRSDFGITWNDTWAGRLLLADEVEITLAVALIEAPS
ncbi:MAG: YceI family protein [Acidobacteria bacterium]|nr:YceI family protein [Acidobacteriota bacterium]